MTSSGSKTVSVDELLTQLGEKEALLSVLGGDDPENVIAVIEELTTRRKLSTCVSELDRNEIGLLLKFLQEHLTTSKYSRALLDLAKMVFELKTEEIIASDKLVGHARKLECAINKKVRLIRELMEFQAALSYALPFLDNAP